MGTLDDKRTVDAPASDAPGQSADNGIASALAFARQHVVPTLLDLGGGARVVAVPPGMKVASIKPMLDEYLAKPERLRGVARLETVASFTAHAQRFKDDGSALFARLGDKPSLTAVYDYHPGPEAPRFAQHRAEYTFPLSRQWDAWKRLDGKEMTQSAFASFAEDHASDVLPPTMPEAKGAVDRLDASEIKAASPSQWLAFSRGLDVRVETNVTDRRVLANGSVKILYDETVKGAAGEALDVPGGFVIGLPLFDGGLAHAIAVRLRFRVEKGRVLWTFAMLGADDTLREAVTQDAESVRTATGLPLFYGTPEG